MNKKNKLLLSSVGLLLVSGFAATASTFAWFTTVRSASVNFSSATITTNNAGLEVKYNDSKSYSTMSATNDGNNITLTGGNKVTDISGNGVNFYKPTWNAKSLESNLIADKIDKINYKTKKGADKYFVDFALDITRTGSTTGQSVDEDVNGLMVFLGSNTRITAKDPAKPADVQAVKAARLAVVDADDNVVRTLSPETETTYSFIEEKAGAVKEVYGLDGYGFKDYGTGEVQNSFPVTGSNVDAVKDSALIADLSWDTEGKAIKTVTLNFRAWIEGTDKDAINIAIGGVFNIELDIYALEVAKQ